MGTKRATMAYPSGPVSQPRWISRRPEKLAVPTILRTPSKSDAGREQPHGERKARSVYAQSLPKRG